MLASENKQVASLIHHHRGSATAAGSGVVDATTIDALLLGRESGFDVLKIDIDGSDGEALAGAGELLRRDHPAVIFEWHPTLIAQTGNSPFTAFSKLHEAGYRRLLWFRNTGQFSHFSHPDDPEIQTWEKYLRAMHVYGDPHFDIVALPPVLEPLTLTLAALGSPS
jgi:hypothetical protein